MNGHLFCSQVHMKYYYVLKHFVQTLEDDGNRAKDFSLLNIYLT